MEPRIAALLLAAGGSSRMGEPKQLLSFRGRSLLRCAAEAAVASPCRPVFVVLGAQAPRMEQELDGLPVRVVRNDSWERGIGASIRAGVEALMAAAEQVEGVVLLLCDQPMVGPDLIGRLIGAHHRTGKPIAASSYEGTCGVPALFSKAYFPALLRLPDGQGAKGVIAAAGEAVCPVPCPEGAFDVDTAGDRERLREL
jgi:molybdenum cofactor cytidylyltransferase